MAKVLFVDDEPNVLDGIRRQLRNRFDVTTAVGGAEGLEAIAAEGPFAVVVSDMRMPAMNGVEFLSRVRKVAPDTVRMILSGQADLESTIAAVNSGAVFQFLTKPCETDALTAAVDAGCRQYQLVVAEKELLQDTLGGLVKLLTEVLALVSPEAFSRSARIERHAMTIAEELECTDYWEIRLAAMLSQLGCLTVPQEVMEKVQAAQPLTDSERELYEGHPGVAADLLRKIPRLNDVAELVAMHVEPTSSTDVSALPADVGEWPRAVLSRQIVRAAALFEGLLSTGHSPGAAYAALRDSGEFAKPLVAALSTIKVQGTGERTVSVGVEGLRKGMIFTENVITTSGVLLIAPGQEVSDTIVLRLANYRDRGGIAGEFLMKVPAAREEAIA